MARMTHRESSPRIYRVTPCTEKAGNVDITVQEGLLFPHLQSCIPLQSAEQLHLELAATIVTMTLGTTS